MKTSVLCLAMCISAWGQATEWCDEYPIDSVYSVADTVRFCWNHFAHNTLDFVIRLSLNGGRDDYKYCIEPIVWTSGEDSVFYHEWVIKPSIGACARPMAGYSVVTDSASISVSNLQNPQDSVCSRVFRILPASAALPRCARRPERPVGRNVEVYSMDGRSLGQMKMGVVISRDGRRSVALGSRRPR